MNTPSSWLVQQKWYPRILGKPGWSSEKVQLRQRKISCWCLRSSKDSKEALLFFGCELGDPTHALDL